MYKVLSRGKTGRWRNLFEGVLTAMNYFLIPSNIFVQSKVGHTSYVPQEVWV